MRRRPLRALRARRVGSYARIVAVRRVVFAIAFALLTFSVSGLTGVVLGEPCVGYEQSGREDGACPPTCVTCGCCAQGVESIALVTTTAPDCRLAEVPAPLPRLSSTDPRDILHVPKPRV